MTTAAVGVFGATGYAGRELVRLLARPPARAPRLLHRQRRGPSGPRGGACSARPTPTSWPSRTASPRPTRRSCARRGPRRWWSTSPATCACPTPRPTRSGTATTIPRRACSRRVPYGLPEVFREEVRGARLVGEPRLLRDLGAAAPGAPPALRLVAADDVVVDAKSGATGAGRTLREDLLFCELDGDFSAYAPGPRPPARRGDGGRAPGGRGGHGAHDLLPAPAAGEARHPLRPLPADSRSRRSASAPRPTAGTCAGHPQLLRRLALRAGRRRAAAPVGRGLHQRLPDLGPRRRRRGGWWSSRPSTTS